MLNLGRGDRDDIDIAAGEFFSVWAPRMLSVLRIVVAALYMQHGMAKFFHVPHVASLDNVQLMSLIGFAGGVDAKIRTQV